MSKQTSLSPVLLSIKDVNVLKQGKIILENISLKVSRKEIVTLIGPNGSGKSTLVKTALGLITPNFGIVNKSPLMCIGYVPQAMHIDETLPMTVQYFLQLSARIDNKRICKALAKTGAEHLARNSLHHLSGGEMRRILLARALLHKPDLLILDEPTAGIDISGQANLYALFQSLRDDLGCGILLVSHDLHIVMAATDKVVCLNHHLCCQGTPAVVSKTPEFVALFGQKIANELALYHHHHDHEHGLYGEACNHDQAPKQQHG